jgi:two-component system response regulator YesN
MRPVRILIADDEEITCSGLVSGVDWERHNIQVLGAASNGMEALLMAQEYSPDLILSDVNMPVMNGLQMIEHLKAEMPSIRIIIISGYQEFEYAQKAITLGVDGYLLKPLDEEELVKKVLDVGRKLEDARHGELKRNLDYLLLHGGNEFLEGYHALEIKLVDFFEEMKANEALDALDTIHALFMPHGDCQYYKSICIRQLVKFRDIMKRCGLDKELTNIGVLAENELFRLNDLESVAGWQAQKVREFITMMRLHSGSKTGSLVRVVENYVTKHYASGISLKETAAHVFISPQYLSRVFHLQKGVSFIDWLNGYRIQKAKLLLADRNMLITEVAERTGFNDYKYFSNVFKKYAGATPRDYRKRLG